MIFQIDSRNEGDVTRLTVAGVIDENADLTLLSEAKGTVEVDMSGVRRINSFGVRAWIDVIRVIPRAVKLRFVCCSPPVVDQCNMVGGFLGHGKLISFYAPMTCEQCDEQSTELFDADACRKLGGTLPSTPCPRCKRDMEIDDLEEQYLLFINSVQ